MVGGDEFFVLAFIHEFLSMSWDFFTEIDVPGLPFSFAQLFVGLFLMTFGLRLIGAMIGVSVGSSIRGTLSSMDKKPKE